jgi:hypothetical protein
MSAYEKLGAFYLGKSFDMARQKRTEDLVLYDARDLTTHAVIIGMTGSGKTGLGIALLEEALIDGIPIIAIDPKGDLPNLLLAFPELRASEFRPWINEQDALNAGTTPDQFAAQQAKLWRSGLAEWNQDPERIARLKSAAEFTVFTPGSTAGAPVNVLRNFSPPAAALQDDRDLLRERIQTTTNSLLALLGLDVDPIASREHILLANLFEAVWAEGKTLDLSGLIHAIQTPPFQRIGVMDLEAFFPAGQRFELAMRLNNLLASPGFEAWLEGHPLDVARLLFSEGGRPRASIFTISHLTDSERMFFVAMLLNEIVAWMRSQPGTASLRALLYMDEIFGYLPPVRNPPSKGPLLTLLKQARAFGLGLALSTQNPVDLDYKGLSNAGTWFIGRLQTERDKERVMAGLEGAAAGAEFDRQRMGENLAGLGRRVFMMNNVHETAPLTFETRWVLSYLRGPLTRDQIKRLKTSELSAVSPAGPGAAEEPNSASAASGGQFMPPVMPPGVQAYFLPSSGAGRGIVYRPAVAGWLEVHYQSAQYSVDQSKNLAFFAPLVEGPVPLDWDQGAELAVAAERLASGPVSDAVFADLPPAAQNKKAYARWRKDLLRWVRQNCPLCMLRSRDYGLTAAPGMPRNEFLALVSQAAREKRDLAVEKLRRKYQSRFNTLQNRLLRAEQAIAREQEQARSKKFETAVSFGTAILGAFLGRKAVSAGSATRFGSAVRSAGRMQKERMDVARALETAESVREQLSDLDRRLQEDIAALEIRLTPQESDIDEIRIKAKSADITLSVFGPVWMPYRRDAGGRLLPDWS